MWFGSTAAAPLLEAGDSPIAGNVGYTPTPTNTNQASADLSSWGIAIPGSSNAVPEAWEYIRWATSAETVRLIGENSPEGWAAAPSTRLSTFEIPEYIEANDPHADITLQQIRNSEPNSFRGAHPTRNSSGSFIFDLSDVFTRCATETSAVIAGDITTDEALNRCQEIALSAS